MAPLQDEYLVYAIADPRTDEIRYVGQTCRPKKRRVHHLRGKAHGDVGKWERELLGEGVKPKWMVLEKNLTAKTVDERETFWISEGKRQGWSLLNSMPGGIGWTSSEVPESVRQKISRTMKKRWQDPEFKRTQVRKMTEALADPEVREKISKAIRGRKLDEETRSRISETVAELWQDENYRNHMSEVHKESSKQMWEDPEFRERHLEQLRSEETRKKISEASKRMWRNPRSRAKLLKDRCNRGSLSEEHKEHISEGLKRYYEDPDPETIAKLSEKSKRMWRNPEYRKRFSQQRRGRKYSEEHSENISRGLKRYWQERGELSEEERLKMGVRNAGSYPAFENIETGKVIPAGENLSQLCRDRDINRAGLCRVIRGQQESYKGWALPVTEDE